MAKSWLRPSGFDPGALRASNSASDGRYLYRCPACHRTDDIITGWLAVPDAGNFGGAGLV